MTSEDRIAFEAERERAVRFLGYHRSAGALDEPDHAERVRRAGAADTSEQLYALFGDLRELTDLPADAPMLLDDPSGSRPAAQGAAGLMLSDLERRRRKSAAFILVAVLFAGLWAFAATPVLLLWVLGFLLTGGLSPFSPARYLELSAIAFAACGALAWVIRCLVYAQR
ncbi:MAG: DUF1707 domain-containing protein [Solirubrobacterales bacterium]|nr:DUF1707 domain-containing protein [Solirubrobacterales bacterium]